MTRAPARGRNARGLGSDYLRPRLKKLVTSAYRVVSRPPSTEQPIPVGSGQSVPAWVLDHEEQARRSAGHFLDRLPGELEVSGKSVLDVGCGSGHLCLEFARLGARRVFGIEIAPEMVTLAGALRSDQPEEVASVCEFRVYGGDLNELGEKRFDIVVSKDSFEHYGAHPTTPSAEAMVSQMIGRMNAGGILAIGFGPLWKGPTGGHIDTWLPWAHLIFPESVIFDEFRRVRPPGKTARTFEEGVGVNRMTLARFKSMMRRPELACLGLETNVSDNPVVTAMNAISHVPGLTEYFTANVYGLWRLRD
jgi:2-polyprenyl-3-methyl-5-hydroxy-6-metoxy-1,4-benzoquinol methylase